MTIKHNIPRCSFNSAGCANWNLLVGYIQLWMNLRSQFNAEMEKGLTMKTRPFPIASLLGLALLTGCATEHYGPYSPDYYPNTKPPFRDTSGPVAAPKAYAGAINLTVPAAAMVSASQAAQG